LIIFKKVTTGSSDIDMADFLISDF